MSTPPKLLALALSLAFAFLASRPAAGQEPAQPKEGGGRIVASPYMWAFSADYFPGRAALPSKQCNTPGRPHPDQIPSSDAATVSRWDVEQAKEAGIDAFAIWMHPRLGDPALGRQSGNFQSRARLEALFTEMRKGGGLTFYPDYWWYKMDPQNWATTEPGWKSDPMPDLETEMRRQGEMLADWAVRFGDVWTKCDGKLLIGMQDHALFKNMPYEKAVEWLFKPLGGRGKVYLALSRYPDKGGEKIAKDWLDGADAIIDWDANRSYGDSLDALAEGRRFAEASSKKWWPSFAPGFRASRSGDATAPKVPLVHERLGVMAFRKAWLDAISGDAPAVYLITWNDISEDTEIMPTDAHGYALQRLSRFFSDWHRKRQMPKIEREELLMFHHPQVVEGLELPAGRQATVGVPSAKTPPTDYVAICSFLREPLDVSVFFQRKCVAETKLPAGFHSWLLYHPAKLPADAPKGLELVYPKEEPGLSVTVLPDPFEDMELSVRARRNGADLGRFFSHQPVVSAGGRGDLGTVGDLFVIGK